MTHAWGMTEMSPLGSLAHEPAGVTGEAVWEYRVTQGRLACAVEGRLTGDDGTVLPSDGKTVGELEVRGPWITSTYIGDAEPDPEKFSPDGWLRTGDVGAIDRYGNIRLSDRTKDLVKSGGEWISSVELENHLMAHPAVAEAAVIAVPHPRWQERPLATVVLKPGESATKEELIEFLTPRVAKWWLPDDVVFIDEVPKTSVGKFSKKDLRARFADYELPETS
jgi:fatty-acyl-CoA synthase